MTIYRSVVLDSDEAELYRHLVAEPSGRCAACGGYEPCRVRLGIGRELARSGRLPRRQPGVVGARVFNSCRSDQ
jgi:hypothetical protein